MTAFMAVLQSALHAAELAEVEMRYAGWGEAQVDNPGRLEAYQRIVAAIYNIRCEIRLPTPDLAAVESEGVDT